MNRPVLPPGFERRLARLHARAGLGSRASAALLIALLLVMPIAFGIHDLTTTGDLTRLGNNLVDGVSNGAIWALIALGYTMVYGIVELINFAHGEVFMIGSLVAFAFWTALGLGVATAAPLLILGLLLTLVVAAVASGSLNLMIERAGYRPLRLSLIHISEPTRPY